MGIRLLKTKNFEVQEYIKDSHQTSFSGDVLRFVLGNLCKSVISNSELINILICSYVDENRKLFFNDSIIEKIENNIEKVSRAVSEKYYNVKNIETIVSRTIHTEVRKQWSSHLRKLKPITFDEIFSRIPLLVSLSDIFKLNVSERKCLFAIYGLKSGFCPEISEIWHKVFYTSYVETKYFRLLSQMFDILENAIVNCLFNNGKLEIFGLVVTDGDSIRITSNFNKLISKRAKSFNDIVSILFKKVSHSKNLSAKDFYYVKDDYEHIKSLLKYALDNKISGCNILIYGNPGVGKNEIASILAKELGFALYTQKYCNSEKNERLNLFLSAEQILDHIPNSVWLIDEAEDVFTVDVLDNRSRSKYLITRVLEDTSIPMIWLSNDINHVDSAFIRRFSYVLELKAPPLEVK